MARTTCIILLLIVVNIIDANKEPNLQKMSLFRVPNMPNCLRNYSKTYFLRLIFDMQALVGWECRNQEVRWMSLNSGP